MNKKRLYKFIAKYLFGFGKNYLRIYRHENDLNIDFLIGPFLTKRMSMNFAEDYLAKNSEVLLECETIHKSEIKKIKPKPTFRKDTIKSLCFNKKILNIHKKEFLLGQILKLINKSSIVIDVGANTGLYSSAFAENAKKVFSFEVSDPVLVQLKKTSLRYKNIKIIQKAPDNITKKAVFFIDNERFSNSSLIKRVKSSPKEVECIKLDDFFVKDLKIDLVKIDTEGSELSVLEGMNNIVIKCRPFVMIECWWKQSSYKHSDIFSFFKDKNYFCYANLRSCGLVNINDLETFEKISNSKDVSLLTDSDFLFAPERLW